MTPIPRTTVLDVLACFNDEFAEAASAFARGEYLLWLGSGISREVVPPVPQLLRLMLEFLQANCDHGNPSCRYLAALNEVLEVAGVSTATVDLTTAAATWPNLGDIIDRLNDYYADVLDVQVLNESEDFLVWVGLNVPSTYGAPDLKPDIEHLCVAILMLEGVVRSAPTTNWDGLVETALDRLAGEHTQVLKVIVTPADFRAPNRRAELVKFHGCAVRAARDPSQYRELLIARRTQISGWTTKPHNQMMKSHLENLFASQPALIVGLSAQDANIHTVLNQASQNLAREWPTKPPAVVFAEQTLHRHHRHVMKVTYGESYSPNSQEVNASALLGAYAKPTLIALVLYTFADKIRALIRHIPELDITDSDFATLEDQVCLLRDALGSRADPDQRTFLEGLIAGLELALWIYRTGKMPAEPLYQAISTAPIEESVRNPDYPSAALGRLGLTFVLIGRGVLNGIWKVASGRPASPSDGVIRIKNGSRVSKVFVIRDARVLSELEIAGNVDMNDPEVLIVQTEAIQKPQVRSPRPRYGRSGRSAARQVDIENLCASVDTAHELFEAFTLASAL